MTINLPMWSVRFLDGEYASARVAAKDREECCALIEQQTGTRIDARRDVKTDVAVVTACGRVDVDHSGVLQLVYRRRGGGASAPAINT